MDKSIKAITLLFSSILVLFLFGCDSTSPTITLVGSDTIYIEYEDIYIEEGVTVTDNKDSSLDIIVSGDTVNTSILGTYIIKYNVADKSDNQATEVTRTVIVQDTTSLIEL